ncbi:hypothetical protein E3P92_01482 [Wallemia ichthyophaga]|uniref:AGC-kinase C-terminal domain-containing protein n=1 Tax=Wallemia ichthyophaga TaxID=245174 RepID=A0A4T0EI40_WALIC|nr:hypothetical protein E3P91_01123 [Wallemia ichthyophaga]TIB16165.1 hypothetical protein E3P92_01482 [Wallemia ichthyophaga]TIB42134.1 hypothetical protein E3P86_00513 [Wallemia ichthyophaga]
MSQYLLLVSLLKLEDILVSSTTLTTESNSTLQPRGVTSKSNKIMPRFDSPVNKLNRDPDINDANFEDADINVDENRAYFDYLFSDKEAEIL